MQPNWNLRIKNSFIMTIVKKPKKSDALIPQARLMRLLKIIALLKADHYTIKELSEQSDISERTVYRYLKLLEEVDFIIEKDFHDKYFIATSDDEPGRTQFTIEEMKVIKKMIQAEMDTNPMKGSMLKKLSLNSELDSIPRLFLKVRLGKLIDQLATGIRNKRQVVLKNYHSANSSGIRDRLVEPIQFGDNYQTIFALDTQDQVCKQFKLDRIGEVIEMKNGFKFESSHTKTQADIFGFVGDADIWVTLQLSMRAYLLLREEHPLSIQFIEKIEDRYKFHGPISHFEGIGRFVLGLIDEIIIVKPDSLKHYVDEKIKKRKSVVAR